VFKPTPVVTRHRLGSTAAHLLGLRVRIHRGGMGWGVNVTCECCVFSGKGLSVGLITGL
jgi:hypothetical protein